MINNFEKTLTKINVCNFFGDFWQKNLVSEINEKL